MTTKEILNIPCRLNKAIEQEKSRILEMESVLTCITSTLSSMPKSKTHNIHHLEDRIIAVEDKKQKLKPIQKDISQIILEITEVILKIEGETYRNLLLKRYISFMTWEKIANDMGYSKQYIYQLHRKAICLFEKVITSYPNLTSLLPCSYPNLILFLGLHSDKV